jgi:hypothetical protein
LMKQVMGEEPTEDHKRLLPSNDKLLLKQ